MQGKFSSIVMFLLIAIGVVLFVLANTTDDMGQNVVNPILYGSYIYGVLALLATVFGVVVGIIANPSGIKEMVIGIVGMVVIFGASWALADGSDYEQYADLSEGMSRYSGMLLYAIYILFGASVLTVGYSWIHNLMK